jgi:hypothetical protein
MLLKFAKWKGSGDEWVNPDQVASADTGTKEGKKYTILHMNSTSKPKIFLNEPPEELNKIFAKYQRKKFKIEEE